MHRGHYCAIGIPCSICSSEDEEDDVVKKCQISLLGDNSKLFTNPSHLLHSSSETPGCSEEAIWNQKKILLVKKMLKAKWQSYTTLFIIG